MNIEIKKSIKPVKYINAIKKMEDRLNDIFNGKKNELIWVLEHEKVFTGGTSYKKSEILDKSIKLIKTNRGGKITYHGPGQLIFYIVLDLRKRNRDIRRLIEIIETTIIETLKSYNIKTFPDRKNVGVWYKNNNSIEKVAAIGIKVKKWIAYHGFALNISNNINDIIRKRLVKIGFRKITNLNIIRKQNYRSIEKILIKRFLSNLEK